MKHELYLDKESGIIFFRARGIFNYEDGVEAVEKMENLVKGLEDVRALIDTREMPPKLEKDVRRLMQDLPKRFRISRMAMIVTNPALRMISKIVVATMGKDFKAGFFKTEEESLEWLKQEK
ncbi:STAS/SEC14 domain-containing protein [bacterium]|nr:STAS/SEC14 domain-containing protein [bacterium]